MGSLFLSAAAATIITAVLPTLLGVLAEHDGSCGPAYAQGTTGVVVVPTSRLIQGNCQEAALLLMGSALGLAVVYSNIQHLF